MGKTSFMKTGFCAGIGQSLGGGSRIRGRRPGDVSIVPNQDQMSSEFSKFNPTMVSVPCTQLSDRHFDHDLGSILLCIQNSFL